MGLFLLFLWCEDRDNSTGRNCPGSGSGLSFLFCGQEVAKGEVGVCSALPKESWQMRITPQLSPAQSSRLSYSDAGTEPNFSLESH